MDSDDHMYICIYCTVCNA